MAYPGKEVINPITGQSLRFVRTAEGTGGEVLEMISMLRAGSTEPVPHYHPRQREDFTVLEGTITVRMKGGPRTLQAGDTLHVPANTVHSMWNASDKPAVVNWQVRPAMDTEVFFETAFGLAMDGKVNAKGMPSLPQTALLADHFRHVYRIARPPYPVQRVLFAVIKPLARLMGLRPVYPKYVESGPQGT